MIVLDLNSPGDGGAVGDEVGDGLHDVPAVLPPGQPRQDPKLTDHNRVLGVWTNQTRVLTLLTNQKPVLPLLIDMQKQLLSLIKGLNCL